MATLTIRQLSEPIHQALKVRAALNNRSTEAEVRHILEQVVTQPVNGKNLLDALTEFADKAQFSDEEWQAFARDSRSGSDKGRS